MKNAAPKSMPAVTATWPRKLNQPVNQDQAGPFVLAQLGRPVIQAASGREAGADLGHGQADEQRHDADDRPAPDDDRGPPSSMPKQYRVRQPDKIEMIVNETAKFEKPDIRRRSSCA